MNKTLGKNLKRRYFWDKVFKFLGLASVLTSFSFLAIFVVAIFLNAYSAIFQTQIKLDLFIPKAIDINEQVQANNISILNYELVKSICTATGNFSECSNKIISINAAYDILNKIKLDTKLIGTTTTIFVKASSIVDQYYKTLDNSIIEESLKKQVDFLIEQGKTKKLVNFDFLISNESREPESAGIFNGLIGSLFTVILCFAICLPLGVLTGLYLEEFAPKNFITSVIELNINNLAAVPSIVFGLLGLSIFIIFLDLPRSSVLVGALTLSLIALPILIVVTRQSIRAVPPSIKQGALALGATSLQVAFHHTLPLAIPGIATGTILSICRIFGETAPLIMIGMVAFIATTPTSITDVAMTLPVQIYLWADSPETGFVEKTAAAIAVLIAIIIALNMIAFYIRKKYEIKW